MGRITVVLVALAAVACRENGATVPDASGDDGVRRDVASTLMLEIAVSGCAFTPEGDCNPDAGPAACCTGRPPLALSFTPIGSQEVNQFLWNFGDGTAASTERAPSHSYAHPGTYHVTLVGGTRDRGTVEPPVLTVVVQTVGAGGPCDTDVQCGQGLSCLCAPGTGCASAFVHGICSRACDTSGCGSGGVCAAYSLAPARGAGTGAAAPLCLAACQSSAACAPGSVCQTVASASGPGAVTSWTRACLPLGAARDVGASCRDADDALADESCTTGLCADVGALGVCSAACDAGRTCPDGTVCATLTAGRQLCLRTCADDGDCSRDPLLACAPAGTAADAPLPDVCTPKSCTGDATCAPSGRCGRDGVCVRR